MSCTNCKRCNSVFMDRLLIVPYSMDHKAINNVLRYFQYEAPGISSTHSVYKDKQACKAAFSEFMANDLVETDFCGQSAKISKHLLPMGLNGKHLCLKCNRMVCKLKNPDNGVKEEFYEAFLRHVRNSIAHGNVYCQVLKNRIYFVFDDYTPDCNHNLTARIVITRSSLERLMNTLKSI